MDGPRLFGSVHQTSKGLFLGWDQFYKTCHVRNHAVLFSEAAIFTTGSIFYINFSILWLLFF